MITQTRWRRPSRIATRANLSATDGSTQPYRNIFGEQHMYTAKDWSTTATCVHHMCRMCMYMYLPAFGTCFTGKRERERARARSRVSVSDFSLVQVASELTDNSYRLQLLCSLAQDLSIEFMKATETSVSVDSSAQISRRPFRELAYLNPIFSQLNRNNLLLSNINNKNNWHR